MEFLLRLCPGDRIARAPLNKWVPKDDRTYNSCGAQDSDYPLDWPVSELITGSTARIPDWTTTDSTTGGFRQDFHLKV